MLWPGATDQCSETCHRCNQKFNFHMNSCDSRLELLRPLRWHSFSWSETECVLELRSSTWTSLNFDWMNFSSQSKGLIGLTKTWNAYEQFCAQQNSRLHAFRLTYERTLNNNTLRCARIVKNNANENLQLGWNIHNNNIIRGANKAIHHNIVRNMKLCAFSVIMRRTVFSLRMIDVNWGNFSCVGASSSVIFHSALVRVSVRSKAVYIMTGECEWWLTSICDVMICIGQVIVSREPNERYAAHSKCQMATLLRRP